MTANTKQRTQAFKLLSAYVRQHQMRPSRVRDMVLERACQLQQPFTAEQLVQACADERISVATVYNALDLFILARILHAIDRQRGKAATEYAFIVGKSMRMQILCTKCGRVTDIKDKAIERLIKERKYSNFEMQHFSLFVYGECKVCRKQTKNKNN